MRPHKSKSSVYHIRNAALTRKTLSSLCLYGQNRSGFTLVEILLAIFIFAVVLSLIYTSHTGTLRIVDETENQADIYRMARIALDRMYEDLESVHVSQYMGSPEPDEESDQGVEFVGEQAEINGERADSLRFRSRAHVVFSESDQASGTARIDYHIEENTEEETLVLYRKDIPGFGEADDDDTRGLVLCENLKSLSFTYYDTEGEVYDNWDSRSEAFKGRVPRMVSILVEFVNEADSEAPFKFLTTVALPMGVERKSAS